VAEQQGRPGGRLDRGDVLAFDLDRAVDLTVTALATAPAIECVEVESRATAPASPARSSARASAGNEKGEGDRAAEVEFGRHRVLDGIGILAQERDEPARRDRRRRTRAGSCRPSLPEKEKRPAKRALFA
jgi:hypothetical protein